ncbi:hypothetical protein [Marimonas arenosa]|uniref:Uncharacterized protein n=1 Tax=Marimonas arenosa TaxID=1795305 RepID=A0AAE4B520_9RHOB|nr:hypothetical protein [Marimonas arenosa]MDQ2091623.1 hypothetical protein [Marimonas arenosa]
MPEDALIGFEFFTIDDENSPFNGLTIANDHAVRAASQHLNNPNAYNHAIEHLDRAIEAVQAAAIRNASRNDPRQDEPTWDDNVPPDLIGPDDFLL